jgi:hypothetical protein
MVQSAWSGQQTEMLFAFRQQAIEQHVIEPAGVLERLSDTLSWAQFEAQIRDSKWQIEIR